MTEAHQHVLAALYRMAEIDPFGSSDDAEADDLREEMELWWEQQTESEKQKFSVLSLELYKKA